MDNHTKNQSNFDSNESLNSPESVNSENRKQTNYKDQQFQLQQTSTQKVNSFESEHGEQSDIINKYESSNDYRDTFEGINKHDDQKFKLKNSMKKRWFKKVVSYLLVGVISSALTISAIAYFDLPFENGDHSSNSTQLQNKSSDVEYTPTFASADNASIADIVEELSPTIVGVINLQQLNNQFYFQQENVQAGTGSGVIFHKDDQYGYIITNNHVIEGANEVEVSLYDGETVKSEIVGADALTDLAVLKIDQAHVDKVASFGDSSKLRPGDEVIAIGNPLGLEFSRTVTQGIISAIDRTVGVKTSAGEWELDVIQTDAAINPGNSGGALINASGEVIGINSLKIADERVEGLGFAIPANDVLPIAEQLIENGQVKRPFIGIEMYDMADIVQFYRQSMFGNIEQGIVVAGVKEGSPAAKAGLKVNDVIVGINGNEVKNTTELRKYLYSKVKPGDTIELEFYREGKKQSVSVKTNES